MAWLSKSSSSPTSSLSSSSISTGSLVASSPSSLMLSSSSMSKSSNYLPLSSSLQLDCLQCPQVLDAPHQPRSFRFPRRSFGSKTVVKRGFKASWFDNHTWLHYDESKDLAFCFLCMKAVKKNTQTTSRCAGKAFISTRFSN